MDTRWSRSYLVGLKSRRYQIDLWQKQIKNYREQMEAFGGSGMSGDRIQTSAKGDALENRVIKWMERIEKLSLAIYDKLDELNEKQMEAIERISSLKDGRCKDLLTLYYIDGASMTEIAGIFGYDAVESAYKLHVRALEYFEEMADENGWKTGRGVPG